MNRRTKNILGWVAGTVVAIASAAVPLICLIIFKEKAAIGILGIALMMFLISVGRTIAGVFGWIDE